MSETSAPPPGIGAADWAGTPQAVRILVLALQQQVVTLSERVSAVEERTRRSSRNSSQPPRRTRRVYPPAPSGSGRGAGKVASLGTRATVGRCRLSRWIG